MKPKRKPSRSNNNKMQRKRLRLTRQNRSPRLEGKHPPLPNQKADHKGQLQEEQSPKGRKNDTYFEQALIEALYNCSLKLNNMYINHYHL